MQREREAMQECISSNWSNCLEHIFHATFRAWAFTITITIIIIIVIIPLFFIVFIVHNSGTTHSTLIPVIGHTMFSMRRCIRLVPSLSLLWGDQWIQQLWFHRSSHKEEREETKRLQCAMKRKMRPITGIYVQLNKVLETSQGKIYELFVSCRLTTRYFLLKSYVDGLACALLVLSCWDRSCIQHLMYKVLPTPVQPASCPIQVSCWSIYGRRASEWMKDVCRE